MLRRTVAYKLQLAWGESTIRSLGEAPPAEAASIEEVEARLRELSPSNDNQRWLQARALQLGADLSQARWLLMQEVGSAIPMPFLVVVVSWLALIFASLGLFAPRNATVWVVIVLCAISVSTAVFLILELDRPFQGLITLSKEPLRNALAHLDQ